MLEFPWNKKAKNHNGKNVKTEQNKENNERVPYTLDDVDELLRKYNTRKGGTHSPYKANMANGKASNDASKEKLSVKLPPEWRPVSKVEKQTESDPADATMTVKSETAQQEKSVLDIPETTASMQGTFDEKTIEKQVRDNEITEAQTSAGTDSVKPDQLSDESGDKSVASTGDAVEEQDVNEQIKEKVENGGRIVFFEGEDAEPEWDIIEEHHPQLEALAEWIKNKLFESLWGLFISDLNGEKIYARYGFQNTDLKNLLLIPPVVDVELQNDLQQGKVRESLFRTDRNKMLYYMDIENFRIALFLDEEKLNMGMLFSIVKPAIEERIKKMGPIS